MTKTLEKILPYSILLVLVSTVFGQTLFFDFVNYDDPIYVGELSRVEFSGLFDCLKWIFTYTETGDWQPLVWLSLILDKSFYGLNPMGYHFTNLVLHIGVVILFFVFLQLSTKSVWKAFVVVAIFAIHPLRVESVAWVAERKDLFSAFWMMLTLIAYHRYAVSEKSSETCLRGGGVRWIWYSLTLLFYAFGLMTKPMLVTLPVLMLVLDYWPLKRFSGQSLIKLILEKIPMVILAGGSVFMTLQAIEQLQEFLYFGPQLWEHRLSNGLVAYGDYFLKLFWPTNLTFFYWKPEPSSFMEALASFFLLMIISIYCLYHFKKKPYLIVGWLWFLIVLLPVSGIIPMGSAWKADRYTYFAHIGLLISIIWLIDEKLKFMINRSKKVVIISVIFLLFAFSGMAWSYCSQWKNSVTLNEYGIKIDPKNYRAYNNLGAFYLKKKDYKKALEFFEKAQKANPYFMKSYRNLGQVHFHLENWDEAFKNFQEATKMMPNDVMTHFSLGQIYADRGQLQQAIAHLEVGLKFEPNPPVGVYRVLGRLWRKKGNLDNSIKFYRKALELNPDYASVHNNLANVYYMNKDFSSARKHYERAIQIDPGHDNANKILQKILKDQM